MKTFGYAAALLLSNSPLFAVAAKPFNDCTIEDLEGSFKLEYDFFEGETMDYKFLDSTAAITFSEPAGDGEGVMLVDYCFIPNSDNVKKLVAVQAGFVRGGILPVKIVKFEDEKTDIFDEYSFNGEYDCESEKLILGFGGYFDGNAYTSKVAEKDDDLALNEFGCLDLD